MRSGVHLVGIGLVAVPPGVVKVEPRETEEALLFPLGLVAVLVASPAGLLIDEWLRLGVERGLPDGDCPPLAGLDPPLANPGREFAVVNVRHQISS